MKNAILLIIDKLFNKKLDFRIRLFHVMGIAGSIIGLLTAGLGVVTSAGFLNVFLNIGLSVLGSGLIYFTYRSGNYQLGYMIVILVVFVVAFPVLFFSAGGFYSGMPSFFVFAVLFTVFMLKGIKVFVMTALELLLYVGICLFAYIHPKSVNAFATEADMLTDMIIAFVSVSVILGVTMFLHFRIYDEHQQELEKARRKLLEKNDALERLDQLKTEFLSNVSHELKTPLTVMSGYAQTAEMQLVEQPENEAVMSKMKIIASEADRLALMVGQILDVTQMEEGHMTFDFVPCRVEEMIHQAVETHFPILNKNNNKLCFDLDASLPKITADPARLTQVIVNLIANAIRFTQSGVITLSAHCVEGFVEIVVSDNGRGIEPDRLPTIFDRFNHAKKPGGGSDTGTGLGLYICKNIVEAHGGTITMESESGKGSTVRFTVPVA